MARLSLEDLGVLLLLLLLLLLFADCGCGDELLGQKTSAQCQDSAQHKAFVDTWGGRWLTHNVTQYSSALRGRELNKKRVQRVLVCNLCALCSLWLIIESTWLILVLGGRRANERYV